MKYSAVFTSHGLDVHVAIWLDHKKIVPNENRKQCLCRESHLYTFKIYKEIHILQSHTKLNILETIEWLPGIGGEGKGSKFRSKRGRQNGRGKEDSRSRKEILMEKKKITFKEYYTSVGEFKN